MQTPRPILYQHPLVLQIHLHVSLIKNMQVAPDYTKNWTKDIDLKTNPGIITETDRMFEQRYVSKFSESNITQETFQTVHITMCTVVIFEIRIKKYFLF